MKFSPFDKKNKNLINVDSNPQEEPTGLELLRDDDVYEYYILKQNFLRSFETPKNSIVYPKESDYKKGNFIRYFIKKRNDEFAPIIELDEKQYKRMNSSKNGIDKNIYYGIEVEWKLTGPENDIINNNMIVVYGVKNTNERTLINKNTQMPGIQDKLKNLQEFARINGIIQKIFLYL
ncbi:hypothetical protein M0P65_06120 [Candidatus Gracilibacteria bacterium]|nr:hypothetical protein [Candidatus Gracilibacteria bacterium]